MNTLIKIFIPRIETGKINFHLKKKLPYILVLTLLLCIIYLLLIPVSVIGKAGKIPLIAVVFLFLSLVQLFALALIRKEKYFLAAWLNSFSLLVSGVSVLFFMSNGEIIYEAYRPFAFIAVMSVANILVVLDRKQIILMFVGSITCWFIAFAIIYP